MLWIGTPSAYPDFQISFDEVLINKRYHVKALPKLNTKLIVPRESTTEEVSIK